MRYGLVDQVRFDNAKITIQGDKAQADAVAVGLTKMRSCT